MLVPGECLVVPVDEKPVPVPVAERAGDAIPPTAPRDEAEETEPRSFLLILLRALGAIHT